MRNKKLLTLILLFGLVAALTSAETIYFLDKRASSNFVDYQTTCQSSWRTADSLKVTIFEWAKAEGWTMAYELPEDYAITAQAVFLGTFEEAMKQLQESIQLDKAQIEIKLYKKNSVVRVAKK